MSDLYPTLTRLALLRAVKAHEEHQQRGVFAVARQGQSGFDSYEATEDSGDVKVSARCDEMLAAEWIARGPASGASFFSRRWYYVRPAGEAVLAEHAEKEPT